MTQIAIIGLQSRFPGNAECLQEFFEQISAARCFCRKVPADRWSSRRFTTENLVAGKTPTGSGYFLDYDYQGFDPDRYGFSHDEMASLDPQQRLVLEVAWEALENAGIDPAWLAGKPAGVYIGGFTTDYLLNQFSAPARGAIGRHSAAGSTLTMLSNRLSYALDLRGPSLTIDTACASSLSALACAVRDLQSEACTIALAGGVNFMLRPEYSIGMSAAGLLSADGYCKPFSTKADGYGRGEGCGILVLKPLEAALADADRILAVIEAIGTGHDGRTAGISLPNESAQKDLMRQVLAKSGLTPQQIVYVEAHGTGTAQGDSIEARTIGEVYGRVGRATSLPIGSVKANIGHLEAAAGVAGVIKAVAMLRQRQIPPHLLIGQANPAIAFSALNLALPKSVEPLESNQTPYIAVNAFGYGGSNAHVILGPSPCAPKFEITRPVNQQPRMLPLSAQSEETLTHWVRRLADRVESGLALDDLVHTLWKRREHGRVRSAIWATPNTDSQELSELIRTAMENPDVENGETDSEGPAQTLFVFSGIGQQRNHMGRSLWKTEPVFRISLQEVDAVLHPLSGLSVVETLFAEDEMRANCRMVQPVNFALQVGVCRVLSSYGLTPDSCLGHSAGEVAAAWAAGHLSLEDAVKVCWTRSELQCLCAGGGGLLATAMTEAQVTELSAHFEGLEIAALNAPRSTTVTGPATTLSALTKSLAIHRHAYRWLDGDIAYHSASMDPILTQLADQLADLAPLSAERPLISSVTGELVAEPGMDARYWQKNIRAPVLFQKALETALSSGATHCIEIGAKPVLRTAIQKTADCGLFRVHSGSVLDGGDDEQRSLHRCLSRFYIAGGSIDREQIAPAGRLIDLPHTGWNRQRFWSESSVQADDRRANRMTVAMVEPGALPGTWIVDLNREGFTFLQDHRLDGVPILPGAVSMEACLQTVGLSTESERGKGSAICLKHIKFKNPFPLDQQKSQILDNRRTGNALETLAYDTANPADAVVILSARLSRAESRPEPTDILMLAARAPHPLDLAQHYNRLAALGLDHGAAFHTLRSVSIGGDGTAVLAQLSITRTQWTEGAFILHPGLVDGVLQAALALHVGAHLLVPDTVETCEVFAQLPSRVWAWIELSAANNTDMRFDAVVYDDHGMCLLRLKHIAVTALQPESGPSLLPEQCLQTTWMESPLRGSPPADRQVRLIAAPHDRSAALLRKALEQAGATLVAEGPVGATLYLPKSECFNLNATLTDILALTRERYTGRLYLLTRNGQGIRPEDESANPDHTAIWGFGRTLYNELAALDTTLIDTAGDDDWPQVALEVLHNSASSEVVLRREQRLLPRLSPLGPLPPKQPGSLFRGQACYLITGGLGGFGRQLAQWLVQQGARSLVLTTRQKPPEAEVMPLLRTLAESSCEVQIEALDLSDANAVRSLITRIDQPGTPLAGIFHMAGTTRDRSALEMTVDDLQQVLEPKTLGAANLHTESLGCELDHFVLFSSLSSLVGNPRQANYAAANAYLDGLAWARHNSGLPAVSINFGAISGTGMAAAPKVAAHLRVAGLKMMTPASALAGLGVALTCGQPQLSLARAIDVNRWIRYDPRCSATDKMAELVASARRGISPQRNLASELFVCPPARRPLLVAEHLLICVAETVKCPSERLLLDRALSHQGLDSLGAIEIQLRIEQQFGVAVPIVFLIGGQSLMDIGQHITEILDRADNLNKNS